MDILTDVPLAIDLFNDNSDDDSSTAVLPHRGSKQSGGNTISIHLTDSEPEAALPVPSVSVEQYELPNAILHLPAALVPAGNLEIQVLLQGSVAWLKVKQPSEKAAKMFTPANKKCKINVLSSFSKFALPSTASTSKASTSHANAPLIVSSSSMDCYLVVISSEVQTAIYLNPL
ncbi:hypothetical protein EWM64_g8175 [Hericium alpestre]|uniref:Uncharacterized protein n=1 Tax=Hericium alpestre TaxID=135208 RepID=A0A4Y9ZP57_9AGAM|nr:hypothetical protein EWM64_g8175 [Hericium alpestre]